MAQKVDEVANFVFVQLIEQEPGTSVETLIMATLL
jgi:hypothetical protein